MEGRIVFISKSQLKEMLDKCPNEFIPVWELNEDQSDSGLFKKLEKKTCYILTDEAKSIICEYGNKFNDISLYSSIQNDISRLTRNGKVRRMLLKPQLE